LALEAQLDASAVRPFRSLVLVKKSRQIIFTHLSALAKCRWSCKSGTVCEIRARQVTCLPDGSLKPVEACQYEDFVSLSSIILLFNRKRMLTY
jgi:hypothetical protein